MTTGKPIKFKLSEITYRESPPSFINEFFNSFSNSVKGNCINNHYWIYLRNPLELVLYDGLQIEQKRGFYDHR